MALIRLGLTVYYLICGTGSKGNMLNVRNKYGLISSLALARSSRDYCFL